MPTSPTHINKSIMETPQNIAHIVEPTDGQIAELAHWIWESNGCLDGTSEKNWKKAFDILKSHRNVDPMPVNPPTEVAAEPSQLSDTNAKAGIFNQPRR